MGEGDIDGSIDQDQFLNYILRIQIHRWTIKVKLIINQEYIINTIALLDTRANIYCVQAGLIPTQY